jgi:hypothetical protein
MLKKMIKDSFKNEEPCGVHCLLEAVQEVEASADGK